LSESTAPYLFARVDQFYRTVLIVACSFWIISCGSGHKSANSFPSDHLSASTPGNHAAPCFFYITCADLPWHW